MPPPDGWPEGKPWAPRLLHVRPIRLLPGLLSLDRIRLCNPALAEEMVRKAKEKGSILSEIEARMDTTTRMKKKKDTTTDD